MVESKASEAERGQVRDVKKIEDLPGAIIDSLLEGATAKAPDFAVLGMGFLVGYEGMDIMGFLMKPFNEMVDKVIEAFKTAALMPVEAAAAALTSAGDVAGTIADLTRIGGFGKIESLVYPLASLPIQMGTGWNDLIKIITGLSVYPNKHITPATKAGVSLPPGVSYFGPPPVGYEGDWPPYGTTLSNLEAEKETAGEPAKTALEFEQLMAELKLKVLMGCMGALTAYILTRPGVVPAIVGTAGEIVSGALQGAGSAVPF